MDEYGWNYHVPAFGSWDYHGNDNLPYTQCFESARQVTSVGSLVRYGSYNPHDVQDRDLYVAGDLYQNDVVTPAVILVPRRPVQRKGGNTNVKKQEKQKEWGEYSSSCDINQQKKIIKSPQHVSKSTSKAIDQDLYQIPPEFFHVKPRRRKRGFGLFSSCLQPTCV